MVYTFSDLGLLESITDPNGNEIALAYDVNDRLETVSTSGDRSLTSPTTAMDDSPASPLLVQPQSPTNTTQTAT